MYVKLSVMVFLKGKAIVGRHVRMSPNTVSAQHLDLCEGYKIALTLTSSNSDTSTCLLQDISANRKYKRKKVLFDFFFLLTST